MRIRPVLAGSILTVAAAAAAAWAAPTTGPAASRPVASRPVMEPTAPGLEVREWAVFVLDAGEGTTNADGTVPGDLPTFVTDRRYSPTAKQGNAGPPPVRVQAHSMLADPTSPVAMPVGVIRFAGTSDGKVDVSVKSPKGSFVGFWPRATERATELLWRDVTVVPRSTDPVTPAPPDGWFAKLRAGDPAAAFAAVPVGTDRTVTEPFLLYDVKFPLASPFMVKEAAGFAVDLTNTRDAALRDVVLFQGDGDAVRSAVVGDLTAAPVASTRPVPTPPAASRPATRPTTGPATSVATTRPSNKSHATLALGPTSRPAAAALLAPWRAAMSDAGVTPGDADLIAATVARYAADGRRLTAVYRVDSADLDKLLPIEIVPQPARVRRFALVVVRNVDSSAKTEVDDLIAALASDDWAKREAASHALLALGPAALKKLQAAKAGPDLEVTWRVERLLQILQPQQQQ